MTQQNEKMDVSVGDRLWLVPSQDRRKAREIEITKVGRKWATFRRSGYGDRFDLYTGYVDGGVYTSPGRVHPSKEHADAEWSRIWAWKSLKSEVYHAQLGDRSEADIRAAAELLGLELEPAP